jgi:hypothetical protein
MAPLLEQSLLIALREFSKHFNKTISSSTIRHLSTDPSLVNAYNLIKSKFSEQSVENFLDIAHWFFQQLLEYDIAGSNIHLNKDNLCIVQFLNKLLEKNFSIRNQCTFSIDQLRDLKIIHSDIMSVYSNSGDSFLDFLVQGHNNSNNSSNSQTTNIRNFNRILTSSRGGKSLVFNINKVLRFKNHLAIFDIHKRKKTTPSSLFFSHFPMPFFPNDENFVNKHNLIIETAQNSFMELINDTLQEKIDQINVEINTFKNGLEDVTVNSDDLVSYVENKEEDALKSKFIAMKEKAERCETRKFEVKSKYKRNSASTNTSFNSPNSSIDQSNVSNESNTSNENNSNNNYNRRQHADNNRHRSRTRGNNFSRNESRHRSHSRANNNNRNNQYYNTSNNSSRSNNNAYQNNNSRFSRNTNERSRENNANSYGQSNYSYQSRNSSVFSRYGMNENRGRR